MRCDAEAIQMLSAELRAEEEAKRSEEAEKREGTKAKEETPKEGEGLPRAAEEKPDAGGEAAGRELEALRVRAAELDERLRRKGLRKAERAKISEELSGVQARMQELSGGNLVLFSRGDGAQGRPALSPTKAALRDRLLLKIAQTAGIRVIREGTEAIAASAARAQGEARMNAMRRRKLKPHEWFVASAADYARLASQVGTLWHERGDVDAYYLDGAVFVCKKRRVHGDFEVLDVFSTDVSYEEFESRRRRAHEKVVHAKTRSVMWAVGAYRNEFGLGNGGADWASERSANARAGRLDGETLRNDREDADAGRSDAGDVVHTADGQVFAYRVGGAYGKEHYAKDAAARGLRYSLEETFPATEAERAEIERSAKARGTWLKAPNGQDTKLTPMQWVTVRTRAFKEWFGDWEFERQLTQILQMPSVHSLTGAKFQKDGVPLTDKVTAFWKEKHNGIAINPVLGEVKLDREGVKDSLGHGIGSLKSAAFAAVPYVIEGGVIFDRQTNWKGRGYDTAVLAAPITIGGEEYICEVVVKSGKARQGFYLHEVKLKEKVENVLKTANGRATSPTPQLILNQKAEKVKQEGVSRLVDENGEPLVVWHGSPSDFNEFSLRYLGTNGTAEGYGFYFTDRRAVAESYARGTEAQRHQGANGRLFEVFLNIAKPLSNERVTMTREEFRRFLRELSRQTDADGNPLELLSSYGDAAYEGAEAVMKEAERLEYDGNDNDVDIVHSIINAVGDKERVFRVLRSTTGFDGIVADNPKWGGDQTVYVAFNPTQIKSATENVGTFDAGNPDIRYSLSMAEQAAWDEVLDAYEAGRLSSRNSHTVLNRTPVVLARILSDDGKNPNLKIVIDRSILDKTTGKTPSKFTGEYHHISVKDLRGLLVNLDNPIAVFDSETIPGDKVVLTEIKDFETGENAVVALAIGTKRGYIAVNAVSSIHGRRASSLDKWLKDGKLRYCNTQKFPAAVGVRWGGYSKLDIMHIVRYTRKFRGIRRFSTKCVPALIAAATFPHQRRTGSARSRRQRFYPKRRRSRGNGGRQKTRRRIKPPPRVPRTSRKKCSRKTRLS